MRARYIVARSSDQPCDDNRPTIYRITIAGLLSRADALSSGKRLQVAFDLAEPGVSI